MSISRAIFVRCDECHSTLDDAFYYVSEARASAKDEGWTFTRDRRDLCPECNGNRARWDALDATSDGGAA